MAGTASAQSSARAWFGVPTPGPVSPPDRPTFHAGPQAYGPAPARGRPRDDARGALSGAKLMADVKRIVGFSLESKAAGDLLYGRISGLPAEQKTVDWAVAKLKASGLKDAHAESYVSTAPLWLPVSFELRVLGDPAFGAGTADVVLRSAMPIRNATVKPAAAEGPLVFVGRGSAAELANIDVKGKIAVVNVVPDDSLFAAREKGVARELEKRGAVGVINAVESPGNLLYYDNRYGCDAAPCFLVGGDDGAFLESVIGRAAKAGRQVRMRLALQAEERPNLTAWNAMATIPGKSPEVVIVNAHADAWFDGADDNADGLSVMLGLADYFAHRKEKPARTLVFMVSGGHHTAVGAAAFIKAHPEIIARTVLAMNLEHLAQIDVTQAARLDPAGPGGYASGIWTANTTETTKQAGAVSASPYVWALMGKASKLYGVVTSYEPTASAPGDLGAYIRAHVTSAQLISSEVYYHSSGDTPSTISVPGLERAAAFYAGFIEDVAATPRGRLAGPPPPAAAR
ncbi:MAG TPA: M28 family peptidase [Phenylobacterium sp.]|uniref:M28 family peptidase n=1 Tax=Phenylobacterium sp. TaxID=1871053 RepID=UPI002D40394A|nr:M28 family peptidase [Phenylobacterium sp.]HZZ67402.1 M28 family peptidase [Phenylobacterium sp.]